MNRSDQQTVRDEADATVRESVRQAAVERERVINAAAEAARAAEAEHTAEAAKVTFKARFLKFLGWD